MSYVKTLTGARILRWEQEGWRSPEDAGRKSGWGRGLGVEGRPELYFRGTIRHTEPKRNAVHSMYISTESLRQPRGEAAMVGQGRGDLLEAPAVKVRGNAGMARGGRPASPEDWPDLRRT